MEKKTYTAEELALENANNIGALGCLIEDLEHAKNVLSRMAVEAKDKYADKLQPYFLYDNNDTLQTVVNLMLHLHKEINEEYKKIDEMQILLSELLRDEELYGKKSVTIAKNDESEQKNKPSSHGNDKKA